MASFAVYAAMSTASHPPPPSLALSGVFGSISLVAWICVLLPQLFANFKAQSADGLSMAFLVVWLLGDVTNLLGALFTHLAPTAIALPSYFCLADLVLISQCVYYNSRNKRRAARQLAVTEASEQSPLLTRQDSPPLSSTLLRPEHDRHSGVSSQSAAKTASEGDNANTDHSNGWVNNTFSLIAVYIVGFAAWFISYKAGAWDATEPAPDTPDDTNNPLEIAGLTLGYISAVAYLCARVPQIIKNYREKSCEGLSLLFFLLSLTGNLTYGVSLVAYSQERKYLLNALPFLLGSVGTIVEDCIIFVQFRMYSTNKRRMLIE